MTRIYRIRKLEYQNSKYKEIYFNRLGKNADYYCFIDQLRDRPYEPITKPKCGKCLGKIFLLSRKMIRILF